jgi:hypothetical protein
VFHWAPPEDIRLDLNELGIQVDRSQSLLCMGMASPWDGQDFTTPA